MTEIDTGEFERITITINTLQSVTKNLTERVETMQANIDVLKDEVPKMIEQYLDKRVEGFYAMSRANLESTQSVQQQLTEAHKSNMHQDEKLSKISDNNTEIMTTLAYLKRRDEQMEVAVTAFSAISHALEYGKTFLNSWWGRLALAIVLAMLPRLIPLISTIWQEIADIILQTIRQAIGA